MAISVAAPVRGGPLSWWLDADARARRAFMAASLGWMLDAFDVMLYSLVLAAIAWVAIPETRNEELR